MLHRVSDSNCEYYGQQEDLQHVLFDSAEYEEWRQLLFRRYAVLGLLIL